MRLSMESLLCSPCRHSLLTTRFLRRVAGRRADRPDPRDGLRRPTIEPLECRIAPANFTVAGTVLTIDLQAQNEEVTFSTDGATITAHLTGGTVTGGGTGVTGVGTGTASITSAGFTAINVTDAVGVTGNAVHFAASGVSTYPQAFTVTLNNVGSGDITFAGNSTFGATLNLTTVSGGVFGDLASGLQLTGSANLSITATGHDVVLHGVTSIAGTTSIAAKVIEMDNASNSISGALQLTGPALATVLDNGSLNLAASSFAFAGLAQTSLIQATGNITQSGAITGTGGGTLAFVSTGGDIMLSNTSNSIPNTIAESFAVTGTHIVTFYNANTTLLGSVSLGTGAFSLISTGNVTQKTGAGIQTGGSVAVTVDINTNRDVLLNSAANNIAGAVTFAESNAGSVRDISLRNLNDHATAPTGSMFTSANVRNLTLYFDHNGATLPGYNITGALNVTAGGDITQTAGLTVATTTTATVLGDFQIALTNTGNALTGAVLFNAPESTHGEAVVNSTALILGASNVGRGAFTATALTGNITQTGGITEEKSAPAAIFTVTAGTSISLTNNTNDFTGPVTFAGAALTTVNYHNADPQAHFTDLSFPGTVTTLTVVLNHAAIVVPTLNLTTLTLNGQGITQAAGTTLTVSGQATLNANAFPLTLPNANKVASLTLSNSGRNDVTFNQVGGDLTFTGTSAFGAGRLTVTNTANIFETGVIAQTSTAPAGAVSFSSSTAGITLNGANVFTGPFSATVTGTSSLSVTNSSTLLSLGQISTGTGAFTATSNAGIAEDPNSHLSLGGSSTFSASGGAVILTNLTNTFTGAVGFNATDVSVRALGSIVLGTSNISNTLSVTTSGKATDTITQSGAITGGPNLTLVSGAASITLTNPGNAFGNLSLNSTGAAVSIVDSTPLTVGNIQVGSGTLSLTSGGDLIGGTIVQSAGSGAVTLTTPAGNNISLAAGPASQFRGTVSVVHSKNIEIIAAGDLAFDPASVITGDFDVIAGGVLTLPGTLTNLTGFEISAHSTHIGSNVTVTGGEITVTGAVTIAAGLTLTSGGDITFRGDVTPAGALTLAVPASGTVELTQGHWEQGSNPLTITGNTVAFDLGDGTGVPASFHMTSGTISMPGFGNFIVGSNGLLSVGGATTPNTVILDNGAGNLTITGALGVGFGVTNDALSKTGNGVITLSTNSQLLGTGLAGTGASPVLISQEGLIIGHFANSVDAGNHPHDFLAGSDIVTPAYGATQVTVQAGGVASPTGTATGFLPDGDAYTVKSSLGAAAGLVTVTDLLGNLDIVVRNATSTAASSLSISTTGGGDGFLSIGGVSVHTPGAVSVNAPSANFTGSLSASGTLTALTAHDLIGASAIAPFTLTDGGSITASTAITAHVVENADLTITGALGSFKAVSVPGGVEITAQKFGTITTTADAAGSGAVSVPDPGAFNANLTSTATTATGTVLSSAKIAGALSGIWDLGGNIGSITAASASEWILGTLAGADVQNGGSLNNVTTLSPGSLTSVALHLSGALGTLTTSDIENTNLTAGSFGTIKVVANSKLGFTGLIDNSTITALGNVGGVAVKSLSTAGAFSSSTLAMLNGNATAIAIGRTVEQSSFIAVDTGTGRGNFKSITAGAWDQTSIEARAIGSLKITGNLAAGLFGNFTNSTVTVHENTSGVALGAFSVQGNVSDATFDLQSGNLSTFTVGGEFTNTTVRLADPAFGALGTIQAGDWSGSDTVIAKTIGTVAAVGVKATAPNSPLLAGSIAGANIDAYLNTGSVAAIGKLTTKGDLDSSTVLAQHGIGTVTVGRTVANSFLFADDAVTGMANVGRIATLTAGAWNASTVSANTFGAVKITGATLPENNTASTLPGDVQSGSFLAHGGTAGAKPIGIGSITVAGLESSSTIAAPFGIGAMTVTVSVSGSSIVTDNPLAPASGAVKTLTVGEFVSSTFRGGSLGSFKVAGNAALGLLGNVTNSSIDLDSSVSSVGGPLALGTLTVNGDFADSNLDAFASVNTITVVGRITSVTTGAKIQAGYATSAKIGALTAGAWGEAGISLATDLVTQSIGTITLKGNTHRGFVGTSDNAFVDILSSGMGGAGLGTFTASGAVSNSLIRVSDGNVTSFTAERFISSDLLVGFTFLKADDITVTPTSAQWSTTNHSIGKFTTTASFSATDAADSASFQDSNVVAAQLGNITLSGVNTVSANSTTYGVAFRASTSAHGTVKTDGGAALTPPSTTGQFAYLGLGG